MLSVFLFENQEIRFVDQKPVANDVASILGYKDPANAVSRKVKTSNKGVCDLQTPGGIQSVTVLEEAGIYQLIFGSKLPIAEKFQDWVFEEVLPSIRKTGSYSIASLEKQFQPEVSLKQLQEYCDFATKVYGDSYGQRLFPQLIKKFHPHLPVIEASPEEKISVSDGSALLTPTQLAAELGIYYKTGNPNPQAVNKLLEDLGYQEKIRDIWSATTKAIKLGLCDRKPIETNSKTQKDQLLWNRKILPILKEHFPVN